MVDALFLAFNISLLTKVAVFNALVSSDIL